MNGDIGAQFPLTSSIPFSLRVSLKKGRATEAIAMARVTGDPVKTIINRFGDLRPNKVSLKRVAARAQGTRGLTFLKLSPCQTRARSLMREVVRVTFKNDDETLFDEDQISYTAFSAEFADGVPKFAMMKIGFSRHSIERFIERTEVPVDQAILPYLDEEALHIARIFMQWLPTNAEKQPIVFGFKGEDVVYTGLRHQRGVWVNSIDRSDVVSTYQLISDDGHDGGLYVNVRTHLNEETMKPNILTRYMDYKLNRISEPSESDPSDAGDTTGSPCAASTSFDLIEPVDSPEIERKNDDALKP